VLLLGTGCVFARCAKETGSIFFQSLSSDETSGYEGTGFEEDSGEPSGESDRVVEGDYSNGTISSSGKSDTDSSSDGSTDGDTGYQAESKRVNFFISYFIEAAGDTGKIDFLTSIPKDYRYRQKIHSYNFSLKPADTFFEGENHYARFLIDDPPEEFYIDISIDMDVYDFGLDIAKTVNDNFTDDTTALLKYKGAEQFIESDSPEIKEAAEAFRASDQIELVNQIYNFVLGYMQYLGYNPSSIGAAGALEKGGGDCTEYSDLFVALCRAKGIPARTVEGYTTDASPSELGFGHNWSEVYLDSYGWVPFDTIYDDNNGSSQSTTFKNLSNIYIYTGYERNDSVLFNYHYYAYTYYGDNIEVIKTITVN